MKIDEPAACAENKIKASATLIDIDQLILSIDDPKDAREMRLHLEWIVLIWKRILRK